jgi:autotransporter translocation and assembly factor TamB
LGKTGGELISGEGGSTQAPGQMVADIVSKTVGEDIKKATGLDQLEVEVNGDNGEEDPGGVKVTLGKDLSRRMSVKYQVESRDGEMVGRTSAEYKILENLLMSGFQDNTGTFGGELKFRMEFR